MFFPLVLVVTSLLINLGSPIKEVRRASILCLQALSGVVSHFHLVIDHLVPKTEEITSDGTYVAQVNSSAQKVEHVHTCVGVRTVSSCLDISFYRVSHRLKSLNLETDGDICTSFSSRFLEARSTVSFISALSLAKKTSVWLFIVS